MKAKSVPITIPYRLRSRAKEAGNSEPMLAHSNAIDIDRESDGQPRTPSHDSNKENLNDPSRTPSPDIDEESLDPFRTPSPDINSEPLDDPFRTPSPDIDGEPLDKIAQELQEIIDAPVELRSSPLSEVSLSLPSFSSLSPHPMPLRAIDENEVVDFNDHLISSSSPNLFPLPTDDDDTDYNDHPTSSGSNLGDMDDLEYMDDLEQIDDLEQMDGLEQMDDLASLSLAELHTAEAICQLKSHRSYVEPMNSIFYGPKRNSWAVEKSHGHHTLQPTRQPTPIPGLHQSTNLQIPSAENYGTFSFYGNSSQAFPWSAEAFEKYFPRAGLQIQTQPIVQPYGNSSQAFPWSAEAYSPRAHTQTLPIVQTYEAQNQYGSRAGLHTQPIVQTYEAQNQYRQPQDSRLQYVQPQHVEHSQQTIFPRILGPFSPQRNSISQDAAATAQQQSTNTTQVKGSRKRKFSDETTSTTKRRRRRTNHYIPNDLLTNNRPAPISDDALKRRAIHLFKTDPWLWSVTDVYFSLTNILSYDLHHHPTLLPHPHLGLILSKFVIDGPKLLINLTRPFLLSLGITRADHLAATLSLLEKIRDRSRTYQHHHRHQEQHQFLNPIPMASLQTLAPQSAESQNTVLSSIHQDISSSPLQNGENRKYHFVFGCFLASQTGTGAGADRKYTLSFNTVAQCLGAEQQQRRESVVSSQEGFDQQLRDLLRDSMSSQGFHQQQHRTSVSFVRSGSGRRG